MKLERYTLYFALLVAWVATMGSLYFSEVLRLVPCPLCWYQRILMYPMALLFPIGLLRQDRHLPFYTVALSALGIITAGYHYLLQKTTWFTAGTICRAGVPCNIIDWQIFGFVTIPFLALIAFTLIFFASIVVLTSREPVWEAGERPAFSAVAALIALALIVFLPSFLRGPAVVPPETADPLPVIGPGETTTAEGARLYLDGGCAGCHGPAAEGVAGLAPALQNNPFTMEATAEEWIQMVREGRPTNHPDNQSGIPMPPSGGRPDLSDINLEAIYIYLRGISE